MSEKKIDCEKCGGECEVLARDKTGQRRTRCKGCGENGWVTDGGEPCDEFGIPYL